MPSTIPLIHTHPRFVVVNKPSGMLSVPGKGSHKADCAIARVKSLFPHATGPMVIHRLDMDTSGLLVIALDPDAQRELSMQFEDRATQKRYTALVDGLVETESGEINLPMRADLSNRPVQIIDHIQGRSAITRYRVLARETDRTRIEFTPITGRSHQLRLHAATPRKDGGLGHPILGDVLYGDPASAPRLMLHASYLSFIIPGEAARIDFSAAPEF